MDSQVCSACKTREAFFYRQYSGERLCRKCFSESIEAKVRSTITRYHMLNFNDHLAIAVSGGKDSLSLLHILAKLKRSRPKTNFTAVTVDEGIKGYRNEALEIAASNCKKLEIPHHIVSFKQLYGFTLDELISKARKNGQTELSVPPRRHRAPRRLPVSGPTASSRRPDRSRSDRSASGICNSFVHIDKLASGPPSRCIA